MRLDVKAKMLRIQIGENDMWEGEPLYEAIVKRAHHLDLAGATAYRGILGFGVHRQVHKHETLSRWNDDPILISVIDEEEKVNGFLESLEGMVAGRCLISVSDVTVIKYVEQSTSSDTRPLDQPPDGEPGA